MKSSFILWGFIILFIIIAILAIKFIYSAMVFYLLNIFFYSAIGFLFGFLLGRYKKWKS